MKKIPDDRHGEIVCLYRQEYTMRELRRMFSASATTIRKILMNAGEKIRSREETWKLARQLRRCSERNSGTGNPNYGIPVSDERKKRLSIAHMTESPSRLAYQQRARKIWASVNGIIPEKYVIHHIDGDWKNNDINNLRAVSVAEHMRIHKAKNMPKIQVRKSA
jgi:hypothetical protein